MVKALKARGFRVVLSDYTPSPPARVLADKHYQVSTFDAQANLEVAKKERVSFLATMATDQPVLTAAFVSEKLGLPFTLTLSQAQAATHKTEMKKVLQAHSIPTPRTITISDLESPPDARALPLPWVVKPADNQGQRGVSRIFHESQLPKAFAVALPFSQTGKVVVEEYAQGPEFSISVIVIGGKAHLLLVTQRVHLDDAISFGVPRYHMYCPENRLSKTGESFQQLAQNIADAMQLQHSPLYIQAVSNHTGFQVIEIACRIGGAFECHSIPLWTGFHILEATIDQLEGLPVIPPSQPEPCYGSVHHLYCHPGVLHEYSLREPFSSEARMDFFIPTKNLGERLEGPILGTSCVGLMGLHAPTLTLHDERLQKAWKAIHILDPSGKDILLRFNDR